MMDGLRRLRSYLGLIGLVLMLSACATAPGQGGSSERFIAGREAYLAGDYARAFGLLLPEAEAGHADAQYTVGYMYYHGQGVPRDDAAAVHWIRLAASNGSQRAIHALGQMAGLGARLGASEGSRGEN